MPIVSHPTNKNYRDNFEQTFGPKPKRPNECRIYNTTCPTPDACRLQEPDAPCFAGQVNAQTFTPECSSSCVIVGACTHVAAGSMTLSELEAKLAAEPCDCRVPGPGNGNSRCKAPLRAVCQCACHTETR